MLSTLFSLLTYTFSIPINLHIWHNFARMKVPLQSSLSHNALSVITDSAISPECQVLLNFFSSLTYCGIVLHACKNQYQTKMSFFLHAKHFKCGHGCTQLHILAFSKLEIVIKLLTPLLPHMQGNGRLNFVTFSPPSLLLLDIFQTFPSVLPVL